MWGAVIGDIIGSVFETENHRVPYFELFQKQSRFTDDTVCLIAVLECLIKHYPFKIESETDVYKAQILISDNLRVWACSYFNRGFGSLFQQWVTSGVNRPYASYGNGALMRISGVPLFAKKYNLSTEELLEITKMITEVTHNSEEALNATKAYVLILHKLLENREKNRHKENYILSAKNIIKNTLKEHNIKEPKKIEEYRINFDFNLTCYHTLSVACAAVLQTDNFTDVMYQAVSAGGDSDTISSLSGAIAEAIYGIDMNLKKEALRYFKEYDKNILNILEKIY